MLSIDERPFAFEDMVGNKRVLNELSLLSEKKNYPEVMIFSGPSGTGKTTAALIVSCLLTDPAPIKTEKSCRPNPESSICKAVRSDNFSSNILFYNASNMSKEDVLKLEEEVSYAPIGGGNKVLIVDEAQALSNSAKGATLKLLEKKRKGVYIILCTMNIESFDKAVRSRGTVYDFKAPAIDEIGNYLYNLMEKIGVADSKDIPDEFFSEGLVAICDNCDGSVRQATQYLQRCIQGQIYTLKDIKDEFGFLSNSEQTDLLKGLLDKNPKALINLSQLVLKDQFYYLWKILTDAYLYKITKHASEEWKKARAETLSVHPNLPTLLKVFGDSESAMSGYFRDNQFLNRMASYYDEPTMPKGVVAVQPPQEGLRRRIPQ